MSTLPLRSRILVKKIGSVYTPWLAMEAKAAVSSRLVTPSVSPPRAVAAFKSLEVMVVMPKFWAYSTPSCGVTVSIMQRTATMFLE